MYFHQCNICLLEEFVWEMQKFGTIHSSYAKQIGFYPSECHKKDIPKRDMSCAYAHILNDIRNCASY